jgi:hypothetical protein
MTTTELLDAAFKRLAEVVKRRDSAGEELLADDALELAARVKPSHFSPKLGPRREGTPSNKEEAPAQ